MPGLDRDIVQHGAKIAGSSPAMMSSGVHSDF
jgi:hypothetical protein